MYHWDVRLDPEPTQLTTAALSLPAFDSPPDVQSFRLHFSPLASTPAMDYSCDVAVPPGTPISIGDVFRAIHRAVSAPLAGRWAHWRGDPMRRHVERAFRRRTGARADSDVLRNVDLHLHMADSDGRAGVFFHGIAVEQVEGYTVFRVVLREGPPFP
ncbi:hypothetical protein GSI_14353 [Ganoderma sinense ZZ0214-1]|uniref:DUF6699 domain-containing protein n=1 Tax=Ganoderma sinense ZZ0214-1 TaxID=1077348 RepID=A0A2G8RNF9_9APHY|nr:hypothetical protein GSI_14353 [Ganoderma sinense ZZ0214-1]